MHAYFWACALEDVHSYKPPALYLGILVLRQKVTFLVLFHCLKIVLYNVICLVVYVLKYVASDLLNLGYNASHNSFYFILINLR